MEQTDLKEDAQDPAFELLRELRYAQDTIAQAHQERARATDVIEKATRGAEQAYTKLLGILGPPPETDAPEMKSPDPRRY